MRPLEPGEPVPEGESQLLATRDLELMLRIADWHRRREPGRYTGRVLYHEPVDDPPHLVSLPSQTGRWSEVILEVRS